MKRKLLTALTVSVLLICLACFSACNGGNNNKQPITVNISVTSGAEIGSEITPVITVTEGKTATVTVTKPDGSVETLTGDYKFTVDIIGTWKITATVNDGSDIITEVASVNVTGDATAPVIKTQITDKTAEKGTTYDFMADLRELVAEDNISNADELYITIKTVELDGKFITLNENTCVFENAGIYTVKYAVSDLNANETVASYKITVKGIYVSDADFKTQTYVTDNYEIASATVVGCSGDVSVSYVLDSDTVSVEGEDVIVFYKAGTAKIVYTLTENQEVVDVVEKQVEVKPVVFSFNDLEYSVDEGDTFTVLDYSLNHEISDEEVTVKIWGQNQSQTTVEIGEAFTVQAGITYIEYTLKKGEYTYAQKLEVMGVVENSAILFEDMKKFAGYGATINSDAEFVKYGTKSLKLVLDETKNSNFSHFAYYTNWENGIEFEQDKYNQISMQVYSTSDCKVAFVLFTGKADYVSGDDFTKAYELKEGWNTVMINFVTDIAGQKCNVNNAITKLGAFLVNDNYTIGMHPSDAKDSSITTTLYIDAVFAEYKKLDLVEEPENTAISFDKLAFTGSKNAAINIDLEYVKQGLRSLKMTISSALGANNQAYNAYYNAWGAGITFLDTDYNGITLQVYSDVEITVAFGIGTGGNPNSDAYSGTNYSRPYSLVKGWNEIKICFDVDLAKPTTAGFTSADIKDGISYFEIDSVNASYRKGNSVYEHKNAATATLYVDAVLATKIELGETYTATFVGGEGATGNAPAQIEFYDGYPIVLPENTFTNGTKTFGGWTDGKNEYAVNDEYVLNGSDVTFTAIWLTTVNAEPANTAFSIEKIDASFTNTSNVAVNTDTQYVKDGTKSLKMTLVNAGAWSMADYTKWGSGIVMTEDVNVLTFQVYATADVRVAFYIGTGGNTGSAGYLLNYSKGYSLKEGWNEVVVNFDTDLAPHATSIGQLKDGIVRFGVQAVNDDFLAAGNPNGYALKDNGTILYCDAFVATKVETVVIPAEPTNTAISIDSFGTTVPGAKNMTVNTDTQYIKDGSSSLKLELVNSGSAWSVASFSNWQKGKMFTEDVNVLTFQVYATADVRVCFFFGTGGNTGSAEYSGAAYSKGIALKEGWNEVVINFDTDLTAGSVSAAVIKEGIVHFGAQAVNDNFVVPANPNSSALNNVGTILYCDAFVATKV